MVEVCHGVDVIEIGALRLAREFSVDLSGRLGGIFGVDGRGTDLVDEILLVLKPCLFESFR